MLVMDASQQGEQSHDHWLLTGDCYRQGARQNMKSETAFNGKYFLLDGDRWFYKWCWTTFDKTDAADHEAIPRPGSDGNGMAVRGKMIFSNNLQFGNKKKKM